MKKAPNGPGSADGAAAQAPEKRRRGSRVWRFARRAAIAIVLLAVVARIALPFALPVVLDTVAAGYGLTARYDALDLSLLDGEVTLHGLRVAATGEGARPEPYVDLSYAHADLDVSALWTGTLLVHRIEVDGLGLLLERDADGTIALLEHFGSDATEPETPQTEEPEEPVPLDLTSPVRIETLLAQHVRLRIVDHATATPVDTWIETDVRLTDIGTPDRPARLWLDAHGPALLDRLTVEGTIREAERGLRAELELSMRGAHPKAAAPWLEPLRITPTTDAVAAGARITASAGPSPADATALDAALEVEALDVFADGEEAFAMEHCTATAKALGAASGPQVDLAVRGRVPGVAGTVTADVKLAPSGERHRLRAELSAGAITLEVLAPWLERFGIAPTLHEGSVSARVDAQLQRMMDGALRAELAVEDVSLRDGDRELAGLDKLAVAAIALDAAGQVATVGEVSVSGARLPVRRDADGALRIAGLRTVPATAGGTTPPGSAPEPPRTEPGADAAAPLRFELGSLRVRDASVAFTDEAVSPAVDTAVSLEVDVDDLALGGSDEGAPAAEAKLHMALNVDGVVQQLGIGGTITSQPGPLDLHVQLQADGDGLATGPLGPYLAQLGIEPLLKDGRLRAQIEASVRTDGGGNLAASARLAEVELREGDAEPLLALDELRIDGIELAADQTTIGAVVATNPRLRAERGEDGALMALGMRVTPTAAPAAPREPVSRAPASQKPAAEPTAPTRLVLGQLQVQGARLAWHDAAGPEPISTSLVADARLADLAVAAGAEPGEFEVTLRADGALESATCTGTLALDPADLRAQVRLDARGIRGGPLASYLPPGTTVALEDGRLRAALDARLTAVEAGGFAVDLSLEDVDYRDGDAAEPLLALERARLAATRIDLPGDVVTIAELSVSGAQAGARLIAPDRAELLGLAFALVAEGEAAPPETAPVDAVAPQGAAATADLDRLDTPPHITIEKLDVEVARIRFEDETAGDDTPPIDMRLRVFTAGPTVVLDAEPEKLEPIALELEGAVDPLVKSIAAEFVASPWKDDAQLEGHLDVRGIRGSELITVLPSLADRLDGRDLVDGSLTAQAVATITARRRTATDFDLSRGFGLEATVSDVAFRATPDGEVLAGVDEVYVEAPRIAPDGTVRVARLDVAGLRGRARRSAEGLHALGLTLKLPETPAEPAPEEGAEGATEPTPEPPEAAPEPPAEPAVEAPPGPEVAVDRLSVYGLDFVFEDTSSEPATTVPLTGLDVEVEGFTTRAFTEPHAIRFAVSVTGGDVELPVVAPSRSILTGLLGAAADLATGGQEVEYEQRPFLDELSAQGQLTLHPQPRGGVRGNVASLELTTFRGLAADAGVDLEDGLMDLGFALTFPGDGSARADARLVFDRLDIAEPADGPISTYLGLPAPLNAVLFAVRDDSGHIEIPLSFDVANAEIGSGQITREALKALGSVLADAVAATPLRLAGTVTGTLGLDALFGGDTPLEEQRVAVSFGPAAVSVAPAERVRLQSVADLLGDEDVALVLVHAFGEEDYARAARLANPSPEQTRAVVARLRQRRAELHRQRAELGAETRALLGSGRVDEGERAVLRLQGLDREVGETEIALDKALQLLRPHADRRSERRTRDAALEIGNRRLEAVRDAIVELAGPDARDRVEIRRARAHAAEVEGGGSVVAVPKARKRG